MKLEKNKNTHPVRGKSYKRAPCLREWISSSESHFFKTEKKTHMQFFSYMKRCLSTRPLAFWHRVFITTHFPLLLLSALSETFVFPCWISTSAENQTMLNVAQHAEHRSCVTSSPSKKKKKKDSVFVAPDRMPFECFASFQWNRELGWHGVLMRQPLAAALMNCFLLKHCILMAASLSWCTCDLLILSMLHSF